MIATNGHDTCVPEMTALVDGEVHGPAADIHQRHSQFLLIRRQNGLGRGQLLNHGIDDLHAGAVDARDDVLGR